MSHFLISSGFYVRYYMFPNCIVFSWRNIPGSITTFKKGGEKERKCYYCWKSWVEPADWSSVHACIHVDSFCFCWSKLRARTFFFPKVIYIKTPLKNTFQVFFLSFFLRTGSVMLGRVSLLAMESRVRWLTERQNGIIVKRNRAKSRGVVKLRSRRGEKQCH